MSEWFYCINCSDSDDYKRLEYDVSDNPTFEELNTIAQKILSDEGCYNADDFVSIGKGELIKIEELGNDLGAEILYKLNEIAHDRYGVKDDLIEAIPDDISDLNRRIAQVLEEWDKEHSALREWYSIPNTIEFHYQNIFASCHGND